MREHENEFELTVSTLPSVQQHRGPRLTHLTRRARTALAAGLVGLVVIVLLAGTVGRPQVAALRARLGPAPTATLTLDQSVINVVHWAPWGRLLANGHPVPQLSTEPNQGIQLNGTTAATPYVTSFALARGHYTLEYQADPFPTLRCQISVPASPHDDCPLAHGIQGDPSTTLVAGARMLDMHATPQYLPQDAYVTLEAAVQQMMASYYTVATTIQPGEHYLNAQRQVATADAPMVVSAEYSQPDQTLAHGNCSMICVEPLLDNAPMKSGADYNIPAWMGAAANVAMTYRYTTLDGQVLLDNAPITMQPTQPITIHIAFAWSGGTWRVAPTRYDSFVDTCPLATYDMNYGLAATSPQFVKSSAMYRLPDWMDGCMTFVSGSLDSAPTDNPVALLYRFGIVLALSPATQHAFPNLPVATNYEQQLTIYAATDAP
jgi:hypothetical protein